VRAESGPCSLRAWRRGRARSHPPVGLTERDVRLSCSSCAALLRCLLWPAANSPPLSRRHTDIQSSTGRVCPGVHRAGPTRPADSPRGCPRANKKCKTWSRAAARAVAHRVARSCGRAPLAQRSSSSSGSGTACALLSSSSYCATVLASMVTSGGLSAGDSTKARLGSPTSLRASQRKGFSKL